MRPVMAIALFIIVFSCLSLAAGEKCQPTEPDMLGPFYKPDAPVRSSVGKGYIIEGTVKSSADCSPVKSAQIEFWLAGPGGKYDADHRAIVFSGESGWYRFESNFPEPYFSRPPHIHLRISAAGFKPLITQHYPRKGDQTGRLDIILVPEN